MICKKQLAEVPGVARRVKNSNFVYYIDVLQRPKFGIKYQQRHYNCTLFLTIFLNKTDYLIQIPLQPKVVFLHMMSNPNTFAAKVVF